MRGVVSVTDDEVTDEEVATIMDDKTYLQAFQHGVQILWVVAHHKTNDSEKKKVA